MIIKSEGLRDDRDLSVVTRLACGALAGTTGQTVAYPFDVSRRRLQVSGWKGAQQLTSGSAAHAPVIYTGMIDW